MAINPNDLPDNSYKAREERAALAEKKVEKAVKGTVKIKKNGLKQFKNSLFAEDLSSVGKYIVSDVLVPSISKTLYDITVGAVGRILGQNTSSLRRSSVDRLNYTRFSDIRERDRDDYKRTSSGYFDNDIILDRESDARAVLDAMDDILDTYKAVSVADLNEILGESGSYTDNNWGWEDLHNADIIRVRDGWCLKLPKARPIKASR